MRRMLRSVMALVVALGLMATAVALPTVAQDEKPTVTIGSKDFTESILLAEIVGVLLEDNGYDVELQTNLGGTAVVHQALVNGEVDIYVEYTGTGLLAILGMELPEAARDGATPASSGDVVGQDQVYDIVKSEYQEQFGIAWLEPWGFNNTYAIAVTRETAEEHDLQTISDLEAVAGDMTLGATQEFLVRPDGLPGLTELYGIDFGGEQGLDPGLVYAALENGDVDVITATATDGRIPALDLVVLEDDKNFFPPYYAAPVVNADLLEQYPELEEILNQLAGEIDNETMQQLNAQVDEEGKEESEVARNFLEGRGLIGGGD